MKQHRNEPKTKMSVMCLRDGSQWPANQQACYSLLGARLSHVRHPRLFTKPGVRATSSRRS